MRTRLLLSVVVLFGIAAVLLWLRSHPRGNRDAPVVESGSAPARTAVPIATAIEPRELGATHTAAESPAAPNREDGRIEVQVKSGRAPIAGARVRLHLRGPRDPNTLLTEWRSLVAGVTDRDGIARFAAGPGRYLVSARADGFATARREIARPHGEKTTVVELGLERGSSLSGRTVARKGREAVPLVEVAIAHDVSGRAWCQRPDVPEEEQEFATSDARGRFQFDGLARANYCVRARAAGFARSTPNRVGFPFPDEVVLELTSAGVIEGFVLGSDGSAAAGAAVHLVGDHDIAPVQTGEGGGFSVEVVPGMYRVSAQRGAEAGALPNAVSVREGANISGLIVRLGASASIAGTISSEADGTLVVGAAVALSPHQHRGDFGRAVSNGLGQFLVEGLAPGSYDVVADALGYSQLIRRGITVAAGQRFSLELKLLHKGTVEGRVSDAEGRGIAGAVVSAEAPWGGPGQGHQAMCGADGRYQLTDVDAGKTYLKARRTPTSPGVTQAVNVGQRDVSLLDFTLLEAGVLTGKVSRAGGKPATDAVRVSAREAEAFSRTARQEDVQAEAGGSYRMELLPGDYRVFAYMRSSFSVRDVRVTIEAGKIANLDLTLPEATPQVSGVVVEPDGTPADNAMVSVSFGQNEGYMSRSADEEGRFAMSVPPDREQASYTVTASKGGRMGQLTGISPGPSDVTVQLGPSASIEGRVLSPAGALRGGFALKIGPSSMRGPLPYMPSALEFAGDTFFVDDVRSGTVKLEVRTADGQSGMAEATSAPGEKVHVDIPVTPSASIVGRLIEAETRKPIADARIFTEGSIPSFGVESNLDGTFRIADLSPGSYTLRAFVPGRMPLERTVTVAAAQNLELGDLELSGRPR